MKCNDLFSKRNKKYVLKCRMLLFQSNRLKVKHVNIHTATLKEQSNKNERKEKLNINQ